MNKELGITLIDKAKEKTGSDYRTAKLLGISCQRISDMRHGRTAVQPEDLALLASLAGMDAEAWLVRGVLAKHEGTPKGERLLAALGKASVAIGAAIGTGTANAVGDLLRCIKSTVFMHARA